MREIFINYRREQWIFANWIAETLRAEFGPDQVFLDRPDLKPGTKFPPELEQAVTSAKIVLALIDPTWISVQEQGNRYRRRLDVEDDWVRIELERSLGGGKLVIPVLINGATDLKREELPVSIADLAEQVFVSLRNESFVADLAELIKYMKAWIKERKIEALQGRRASRYPDPALAPFHPPTIEGDQLSTMLDGLPNWRLVPSPMGEDREPGEPEMREEIIRKFEFPSFLAAIGFMNAAAEHIDRADHHPRWENVYQTVTVALSTWDSGHRPSDRDYKMARFLDGLYEKFIAEL